ncbi:MAG TPA: CYTH domain-containing protein [Naasia sp.]
MGEKAAASVETERKYDVPEDAALPDLAAIAATTDTDRFALRAVYYDTADDRLAAVRMTLRRREGGHDAGWHLKTPGADGRVEHASPLADDLPAPLLTLVADVVGDEPLIEIARLDTDRTATTLRDAGGTAFAEVADDRVTAVDARTSTVRTWREWEAELMPGAPDDRGARAGLLDRIEEALLAAGAMPSASSSKLAQATGRSTLGTRPPSD